MVVSSVVLQAVFKQREDALRRKDLDLQEALIKMNNLLAENEAKKHRAEKRVIEEAKATQVKMQEITEGERQLSGIKDEAHSLELDRQKLERYHKYLVEFQGTRSEEFPEIHTILERHATLVSAHEDLLGEAARLQAALEDARRQLSKAQKARATYTLNSENIISKMKDRVEYARQSALALAAGADETVVAKGARSLELGLVVQAVANLHNRCTKGPYGSVIHHNPSDDVALRGEKSIFGRGLEALLGRPEEGDDPRRGRGNMTARSGVSGDGGDAGEGGYSSEEDGNMLNSSMRSFTLDMSGTSTKRNHPPIPLPPVFLAGDPTATSGALRGAGGSPGRTGRSADTSTMSTGTDASGSGGNQELTVAEITGMDPVLLRDKMRTAVAQLGVVGSYIVDYQRIADEYPGWVAEQKRKAEEKAAAAAAERAEAERNMLPSQRAALAAKAAAAAAASAALAPGTAAASGAGGVAASSTGAGAGSGTGTGMSLAKSGMAKSGLRPAVSPIASSARGPGGVGGTMSGKDASAPMSISLNASMMGSSMAGTQVGGQGNAHMGSAAAAAANALGRQGVKVYLVKGSILPPPSLDGRGGASSGMPTTSSAMLNASSLGGVKGSSSAAGSLSNTSSSRR